MRTYVAFRACGEGVQPILLSRCSAGVCGEAPSVAVDPTGAPTTTPFAPAIAAGDDGRLWLVYAWGGGEPVLRVRKHTGVPTWSGFTFGARVGLWANTPLVRDGVPCVERPNPAMVEPRVKDGPTAVVFRGRLHVAARVPQIVGEAMGPNDGTLIYASSSDPTDRRSWTHIVPQEPYANHYLFPRLSAVPGITLVLTQVTDDEFVGSPARSYLRFKFSE